MLLPGDCAASEGSKERVERKQKRMKRNRERERGHLGHCACVTQSRDALRRYHCISSSRSTRKQQNTTLLQRLPPQPRASLPERTADVNKRRG